VVPALALVVWIPALAVAGREDYEARRAEYLRRCVEDSSLGSEGLFTQIARLELDRGPLDVEVIRASLEKVTARRDTSDFDVAGLLRMVWQYRDHPLLGPELAGEIERTLLDFKYWIDEPGVDSMCYWSENHQILFASAEYLLGALYPDEVFTNSGMTGAEHRDKGRVRVEEWLRHRYYHGFSEWHSNVYYNEDLPAVINLVDFAPDERIARRAAMVLDILLFDIAVNQHRGVFGVSHGRSYTRNVLSGNGDATACVFNMVCGGGEYNSRGNMSAISLATSRRYVPPLLIQAVGAERPESLINRESMGVRLEDAAELGFTFEDPRSGMFWWGMGAYADWRVIELTFSMLEMWDLWENEFFAPAAALRPLWEAGLLPGLSWLLRDLTSGSVLSRVDTYTFRTPDYMLASAQDYKPGQFGFQTHLWQATLGRDAVVFTSHPGRMEGETPGYWTGGWLPRVVQFRNVAVIFYDRRSEPFVIPYTHAWFPRDAFDQWLQRGPWTFGRSGAGYVALYSRRPVRWAEEGEWAGRELIADGTGNIWICELGRRAESGSFATFVSAIEEAALTVVGDRVLYDSPSLGWIEVGRDTPLHVAGEEAPLHDYPRYDNPYIRAERGAARLEYRLGELSLLLDFEACTRDVFDGSLAPSPTPEPTPDPGFLGVRLEMPARRFAPGDACALWAWLGAGGEEWLIARLLVALECGGEFWFWPSWGGEPLGALVEVPREGRRIELVPEFSWPGGRVPGQAVFWGALLNPWSGALLGGESGLGEWGFTW
jgi:hypothetical protein